MESHENRLEPYNTKKINTKLLIINLTYTIIILKNINKYIFCSKKYFVKLYSIMNYKV